MDKKYFFDFDGTLINTNSFPHWILFIFIKALIGLKIRIAYKIARLTILRKITNSISHQKYKESLTRLPINEEWNKLFFESIYKKHQVRRTQELLASIKSSIIVLSSAAPYCYFRHIATTSEIDPSNEIFIIGSYDPEKKTSDNYKHKKLENLETLGLIDDSGFFDFCVTDSYEDITVALKSKKTLLINPQPLDINNFMRAISPQRLTIIRE